MFLVVQFNDGMEIIPERWYIKNLKKAYYPPNKLLKRYGETLFKETVKPDKYWQLFSVIKIWTESENFQKAKRDLDHYLKNSESEMSDGHISVKRKRNGHEGASKVRKSLATDKVRRTPLSIDESSNEGCTSLEPFPALPNEVHQSGEDSSDYDVMNGSLHQEETVNGEANEDDGAPSFSTTSKRTDDGSQKIQKKKEVSDKEFQRKLMSKINRIVLEQKRLAETQQRILEMLSAPTQPAVQISDSDIRRQLPLKTIEELEEMNEQISNESDMSKLVNVLKSFGGGGDMKHSCKYLLSKLLSDNLASRYSYLGRRTKPPFKDFILNEAIRSSIRIMHPNTTEIEINKQIENHLRYASQRVKREKKSVPAAATPSEVPCVYENPPMSS